MTQPPLRKFSTAGPEGDGRQAYVNDTGAYLGRGVALLERDADGRWKPRDAAVLAPLLAKGYGVPVELGWRERRLRHIAEALNKGDLFLASLSLVYLELPPLPSDDHARAMAKADGLLVKFNPNWDRQRRDPRGEPTGGRWSGGGVSETRASRAATSVAPKDQPNGGVEQQVALQEDPTHAKKRLFVVAHPGDAQKAANVRHVPVENILGVSALESDWASLNLRLREMIILAYIILHRAQRASWSRKNRHTPKWRHSPAMAKAQRISRIDSAISWRRKRLPPRR